MASKYLGTFGKWDFFIATVFGEYRDEEAVKEIQRARYKLITDGRVMKNEEREYIDIFCTAITLNHDSQREIRIFDDLNTTYHIFALGNGSDNASEKGKLGGACSYALESKENDSGVIIGLPLENKVNNGYPEGFDLDVFRETYEYGSRKSIPEEHIELFRYFKLPEYWRDRSASLGIFRGGFHQFVTGRRKRGKIPVTKWFFCSNSRYYQHIYRPFASMMIPLLLDGAKYDSASPSLKEIKMLDDDNTKNSGGCFYNDKMVSYRYPLIISRKRREDKTVRWFDYLAQLVDCDRARDIVKNNKSLKTHEQFDWVAWRIIAEDLFIEHHTSSRDRKINSLAKKLAKALPCNGWK
jgi:hypothetical protein